MIAQGDMDLSLLLMLDQEAADQIFHPKWDEGHGIGISFVYNWRYYIEPDLRKWWEHLPLSTRQVAYYMAKQRADAKLFDSDDD